MLEFRILIFLKRIDFMLDIALLGTGGMMPMPDRFLSSMIIRFNGHLILTDCGEGTQVSLKNLGWGFKAIDAILFTHYHADHISGLPGMFHAIANAGRTETLKLVGPKGLAYIVDGLRRIASELPYAVEYIELDEELMKGFYLDNLRIKATNAVHSVKCVSYRFDVMRKGRFDAKKAIEYNVPKDKWSLLQKGENVEIDGKTVFSKDVMGVPRKGISITFATDTRPFEGIADFAANSDILICEGMYGENEKIPMAKEKKHMTFSEAAQVAKNANAQELWLTHYSPSLTEPEEFIGNATEIFENTVAGFDGITKTLKFESR